MDKPIELDTELYKINEDGLLIFDVAGFEFQHKLLKQYLSDNKKARGFDELEEKLRGTNLMLKAAQETGMKDALKTHELQELLKLIRARVNNGDTNEAIVFQIHSLLKSENF